MTGPTTFHRNKHLSQKARQAPAACGPSRSLSSHPAAGTAGSLAGGPRRSARTWHAGGSRARRVNKSLSGGLRENAQRRARPGPPAPGQFPPRRTARSSGLPVGCAQPPAPAARGENQEGGSGERPTSATPRARPPPPPPPAPRHHLLLLLLPPTPAPAPPAPPLGVCSRPRAPASARRHFPVLGPDGRPRSVRSGARKAALPSSHTRSHWLPPARGAALTTCVGGGGEGAKAAETRGENAAGGEAERPAACGAVRPWMWMWRCPPPRSPRPPLAPRCTLARTHSPCGPGGPEGGGGWAGPAPSPPPLLPPNPPPALLHIHPRAYL